MKSLSHIRRGVAALAAAALLIATPAGLTAQPFTTPGGNTVSFIAPADSRLLTAAGAFHTTVISSQSSRAGLNR